MALAVLVALASGGCVQVGLTGSRTAAAQPSGAWREREFDRVANLVHRRYYARDLHGLDWDALCRDYRPRAARAANQQEWYASVNAMLRRLGDAHTRAEPPSRRRPDDRHGQVRRGAGPDEPDGVMATVLESGFLHLAFERFDAATARGLRDQLRAHADVRGIILDLRRNRGGLITAAQDVVGCFFPKPVPLGTVVSRRGRRHTEYARAQRFHTDAALVVLIGRGSHSSAEVVAYALHHHGRATLVGDRTAGEVLGARRHRLADGGGLYISETDFFRLEGGRLEGVGVMPDVRLEPQAVGQLAGSDGAIAAAETVLAAAGADRPHQPKREPLRLAGSVPSTPDAPRTAVREVVPPRGLEPRTN